MLSLNQIRFSSLLQVSKVVRLHIYLGFTLFNVLISIFLFGFELFVDGCDDFFILFFLRNLRFFSVPARDQLAADRIVLHHRIDAYVLPFELFLGGIHIHLNLNIMAVFLKINC